MLININEEDFKFLDKKIIKDGKISKENLEHEIRRLDKLAVYYHNKQLAEKTIINASYGALASKFFVGFNINVASSVTEMGRNIVQFGAAILNKYFKIYWHTDTALHNKLGLVGKPAPMEINVLRYGDTDSCYISLEELIDDVYTRNLVPEKYINNEYLFILDLMDFRLNDYIIDAYDHFAKKFNTKNIQKFELEAILRSAIFLAKKKYVGSKEWDDSVGRFEMNKHLKITGIEIAQSSTPKFAREKLKYLLYYIFKNIDNFDMFKFINELRKIKDEFKVQEIENISFSRSIGDYNKFIISDKVEFEITPKCPIHIRGAGYHNFLVNSSQEYRFKYKQLQTGDKVKLYYTKDINNNAFSYGAGVYPYEIAPEIDIDTQFLKTIIEPINRILAPLNVGQVNERLISTQSLF